MTTPNPIAVKALAYARHQIGTWYLWGGSGPRFDCSGLAWASYEYSGHPWPRTNDAGQAQMGVRISQADLIVGDLVRPHVGHIQIYAGGGRIVEAPSTGSQVRETNMWGFLDGTRIVPAVSGGGGVPASTGHRDIAQTRAIQIAVHIGVDGAWGNETARATNAVIQRNTSDVRYLQARVGTNVDGVWGPLSEGARIGTIKKIQSAVHVVPDGAWGTLSQAAFLAASYNNFNRF